LNENSLFLKEVKENIMATY